MGLWCAARLPITSAAVITTAGLEPDRTKPRSKSTITDVLPPPRRRIAWRQSEQRSLVPPARRSMVRRSASVAAVNTTGLPSFCCCCRKARRDFEGEAARAKFGISSASVVSGRIDAPGRLTSRSRFGPAQKLLVLGRAAAIGARFFQQLNPVVRTRRDPTICKQPGRGHIRENTVPCGGVGSM